MGLFSKKKVEEKQELPPLKFPDFSKTKEEPANYESSITPSDQGMIKRAVGQPGFMMPIRKPVQPKTETPNLGEEKGFRDLERKPRTEEFPRDEERMERRPRTEERMYNSQKGKTLFVKVEKYKDVLAKMNEVKAKVGESEVILQKLHGLRVEEEKELKIWQNDLNRVKDTLIAIDKTLSE